MAFSLGNQLASLKVRIGADLTDFRKGIKEMEQGFAPIGKKLNTIGTNMTKFVTLPVLAAGAASIKAAIDFESAFAGVRKTIDATEPEFATLRKGIIDMSKELPASANEISGVAEAAGQLGIETKNVLKFSRVMVDLGETTNLSANEAATAFARFANVTGLAQEDFDKLGSAVVDLGNNFATTEKEIAEMALRLAGAGTQVGLSQSDILGFAAALSSVGVEAEAGGTAFSKLFAEIAKSVSQGGSKLEKFARVSGMAGSDYAQAFRDDAAQATAAFIRGLGGISDSGGDVLRVLDDLEISEIRMRDAILRTAGAGDLLTRAIDKSSEAWRINNALVEEAAKRYGTAGAKLQIAKNEINAAAVEAGSHLVPALVGAAEGVADLASGFADLDPAIQKATIAAAGMLAVAGPLAVAVAALGGPLTLAVIGLSAFAGGTVLAIDAGKKLGNMFEEMGTSANAAAAAIGGVPLSHPFVQAGQAAEKAETKVSRLRQTLFDAGFDIGGLSLGAQGLVKGLSDAAAEAKRLVVPPEVLAALEKAKKEARDLAAFLSQGGGRPGMAGLDLSDFTETVKEVDIQTGKITSRVKLADGSFAALGMTLRETVAPAVGAVGSGMDNVSTKTLQANFAMAEFASALKFNVQKVGIRAVDGLSFAIGDAIAGFESFGKAVKRIMRNVIADLAAAIAKMIIIKGLTLAFGAATGGTGGIIGGVAAAAGFTSGVMAAPNTFQPPPVSQGGGFNAIRVEVSGRLVGHGNDLVAVVDQARVNQSRGY